MTVRGIPHSPALVVAFPEAKLPGFWTLAWRRLCRNRLAFAGLITITALIFIAVAAPLLPLTDPSHQDLYATFQGPSLDHPMGTDNLGRDWFSRVIYGTRLSLAIGLFTQLIVLAIGLPLGLMAGYYGRGIDSALMRLTDFVYAFPDLLLIILLRAVLGGGVFTLFLIIGIVSWVDMARLVRGQALTLREREYVVASQALGSSHFSIMWKHILPNAIGPIIVLVAFGIPRAMFIEASLSFIGIGPGGSLPSWGTMVQEGYSAIFTFPHLVLFPSLAIAVTMLAFTFVGDGLRDALDPRATQPSRRTDEASMPTPATHKETGLPEQKAA